MNYEDLKDNICLGCILYYIHEDDDGIYSIVVDEVIEYRHTIRTYRDEKGKQQIENNIYILFDNNCKYENKHHSDVFLQYRHAKKHLITLKDNKNG